MFRHFYSDKCMGKELEKTLLFVLVKKLNREEVNANVFFLCSLETS